LQAPNPNGDGATSWGDPKREKERTGASERERERERDGGFAAQINACVSNEIPPSQQATTKKKKKKKKKTTRKQLHYLRFYRFF
jgi:hypothetical protein